MNDDMGASTYTTSTLAELVVSVLATGGAESLPGEIAL